MSRAHDAIRSPYGYKNVMTTDVLSLLHLLRGEDVLVVCGSWESEAIVVEKPVVRLWLSESLFCLFPCAAKAICIWWRWDLGPTGLLGLSPPLSLSGMAPP